MRGAHRLLAGLLAAGALLAANGCAPSVDPIERLGRKAAQRVHHSSRTPAAGPQRVHHPSRTPATGPPARGDHGELGSIVVISCRQLPESRHSRSLPPLRHWWPARPGSYEGVDAGAGCERR